MGFQDIVNVIINNGVSVGVLLYFMWVQNNTMKSLTDQLNKLNETILKLEVKTEIKKED